MHKLILLFHIYIGARGKSEENLIWKMRHNYLISNPNYVTFFLQLLLQNVDAIH